MRYTYICGLQPEILSICYYHYNLRYTYICGLQHTKDLFLNDCRYLALYLHMRIATQRPYYHVSVKHLRYTYICGLQQLPLYGESTPENLRYTYICGLQLLRFWEQVVKVRLALYLHMRIATARIYYFTPHMRKRLHGFCMQKFNRLTDYLTECIYGLNLIKTYVHYLDLRVSSHPDIKPCSGLI